MSRILLVGKGFPDRGGIPTFLNTLERSALGSRHEITFLNVAHAGTPEGGEVTMGNVRRTLNDALRIFREAKHHDIVHIHSALAPTVTVGRAGLLALAGRLRGCGVIIHAHGGNIETWLTTRLRRYAHADGDVPGASGGSSLDRRRACSDRRVGTGRGDG